MKMVHAYVIYSLTIVLISNSYTVPVDSLAILVAIQWLVKTARTLRKLLLILV